MAYNISKKIGRKNFRFIGKDGKEYNSERDLLIANEIYNREHYTYIGKDGQEYTSMQELELANKRYEAEAYPKTVKRR